MNTHTPSSTPSARAHLADRSVFFNDVHFSYDDEHDVLCGVTTKINTHDYTVVLGENGSGKSTLAKHINALLVPDSGNVIVRGLDTKSEHYTLEIRRHCAMVFQNPDNQMVATTVRDDVAFGPENLGLRREEIIERVDKAIAEVALGGFAQRDPSSLSGGEKQRVAIAGVLALRPELIVFDEPGAMLDPRGRRGIQRVMRELHKAGIGVVHITHFMDEAFAADTVIVMKAGKIALCGTPAEVFAHADEIRSLGLEEPFALQLAHALRKRGISVPHSTNVDDIITALCTSNSAGNIAAYGTNTDTCTPYRKSEHLSASADIGRATPLAGNIELRGVTYAADPTASKLLRCAPEPASREHGAILAGIDMKINPGEFCCIVGHTGSGKSTLIEHIKGLHTPTTGEIRINGELISEAPQRYARLRSWLSFGKSRRRRHEQARKKKTLRAAIGYVSQYPEYQLFADTVFADVTFGPKNLGANEAQCEEMYREAMHDVGLDPEELRGVSPFELSGGQKRRVACAGILAMRPSVLIVDEPMAGLDPHGRHEMKEILQRLHRGGATIVMVSHSMDDVAQLGEHIVVLNQGKVLMNGDRDAVFSQAQELHNVGLGVPTSTAFAHKLATRGWEFARTPYTLEELVENIANRYGAIADHHCEKPSMHTEILASEKGGNNGF